MQFPGFVCMKQTPAGLQPASLLKNVNPTGVYACLPVFATREEALDPPRMLMNIRSLASEEYEALEVKDIWAACALAYMVERSSGSKAVLLWHFKDGISDPMERGDLVELEGEACEEGVRITDDDVSKLRATAYDDGPDKVFSVDRFTLFMTTTRKVRSLVETLVAKYRGTPRPLTADEQEAIFKAVYIEDLPAGDLEAVEGPSVTESGLSVWNREISIGPRPA